MSSLATFGGAFASILSPIIDPIGGLVSGIAGSTAGLVLKGISGWVLNGTADALRELAQAIGNATAPNLDSTWFSSTYWRVAALAAMLTIPFLCAAAVQAVARADLSLLAKVAFGYLPLSILGVSLAAPLTMLLLAATDQMSAVVSASAATGGARFLDHAAEVAATLATAAGGSPFFAVVVGLLALVAAMALAMELIVRAAAVYVVVLMLPLAFAAMVWPARRIWAVRLVELLASLILAKFVIVAVLSLAAAAFAQGTPGIGQLLVAMSLILLSTFAPWALMRILPFTELAAGAAGMLRNELPHGQARAAAMQLTAGAGGLAMDLPARLRDQARSMYAAGGEPGAEPAMPASAASSRSPGDSASSFAASNPPSDPSASSFAASNPPSDPSAPSFAASNPPPDASASSPAAAEGASAAVPPLGASAGAPERTGSPAGAKPEDTREPFELPWAWQGGEEVHLDENLLRPPASAAGPEASPGPAPSASPTAPEAPPTPARDEPGEWPEGSR